jgi:hypothetical protein
MELGLEISVAHEESARTNARVIDLIGELRHQHVPILVARVSACDAAIAKVGIHPVWGQIALALGESGDAAVAFTATMTDWLARQPVETKVRIRSVTREYELSNADIERTQQQRESLLADLRTHQGTA